MKNFLLGFALVSGLFASNALLAGECGKEVMGGCQSQDYAGVAPHMRSNAVLNAKLNAQRAANDEKAHEIAQKMLADANAKQKTALEADKKKSAMTKLKDNLSLK